jgi:hypothetical protein
LPFPDIAVTGIFLAGSFVSAAMKCISLHEKDPSLTAIHLTPWRLQVRPVQYRRVV